MLNFSRSSAAISSGFLGRPVRIPKYAAKSIFINVFLAQDTTSSVEIQEHPLEATYESRIAKEEDVSHYKYAGNQKSFILTVCASIAAACKQCGIPKSAMDRCSAGQ